jgi:hypothetical protein
LRKDHRELVKENRKLKKQFEEKQAAHVPEKPTLQGCDYDESRYDAELVKYYDAQNKVKKQKEVEEQEKRTVQERYEARLAEYNSLKGELKAPNYEEIESEVIDGLSVEQQNILLMHTNNPAQVVYALGKHPDQLEKLVQIKDPYAYTAELVRIESKLKVNKRRTAPEPDEGLTGSGAKVNADKQLEKLRKEAQKTGDFSKVLRFKKELRNG